MAVCLQLGAPVDDPDCVGQTPLFYAVTHCMAADMVPLLLAAGGLWVTHAQKLSYKPVILFQEPV